MTCADSLDFLYHLQKHGIKLGLDTVESLLDRIGNPHRRYPTLHIGGTNGKGSTAALTASILQAAGYRVGLYTSPHLVEFRERIRINGQLIPKEALVQWTDRLRAAMGTTLEPTFFEFTTAMAFAYFAEMEVDIAVIEVGMGGRFDATNVLQPLASVITNVALDHEARRGEMAALREIPFGKYYGSVDSTPLFIMLAGAYYERTGDLPLIQSIWPQVQLGLEWIDKYGDIDGDGFVEYARHSPTGLVQQGWKDSADSVFYNDGVLADGPIALCEVQGYVFAAKRMIGGLSITKAVRDTAAQMIGEADPS